MLLHGPHQMRGNMIVSNRIYVIGQKVGIYALASPYDYHVRAISYRQPIGYYGTSARFSSANYDNIAWAKGGLLQSRMKVFRYEFHISSLDPKRLDVQ
jgi:hypothetical protein